LPRDKLIMSTQARGKTHAEAERQCEFCRRRLDY
jgi:hypothetical protein